MKAFAIIFCILVAGCAGLPDRYDRAPVWTPDTSDSRLVRIVGRSGF